MNLGGGLMSKLSELKPDKNEVVKIKFKSFDELLKLGYHFHDSEETYKLGQNFKAYQAGGFFLVGDGYTKEEDDEYIIVRNHLDNNYNFYIYEEVIESIEIVQDAEKFESFDHKVLVVRVEDELYINGHPVIWNEEGDKIEYNRNKRTDDTPYENPNRKLLKIFENYIADLAVRESFKEMGE